MAAHHATRGKLIAAVLLLALGFALGTWRAARRAEDERRAAALDKLDAVLARPDPGPFRSIRTNGRTLIVDNEPVPLVRRYSGFGRDEEPPDQDHEHPTRPGQMVVLVDDQVGAEEGADDVVIAADRHALWSYHSSPGLVRLQEMATARRLSCTPRHSMARVVSVVEGALPGGVAAVEVELGKDGERAWVSDAFVR